MVLIGISFLVSIIAPESLNQLIGVVAVFALTCFAGGMPPLASLDHKVIPLRYFYHVSYLRYALEAFYVGEVRGCPMKSIVRFQVTPALEMIWGTRFFTRYFCFNVCSQATEWADRVERSGIDFDEFLETTYGYHLDTYAMNIGICLGWGVGFRLCALLAMMFKDRAKKL